MTLNVQAPTNVTAVDEPAWHVRLTVVWRDEQLPVPIGDESRAVASDMGVRLSTRPGSCVAHFAVSSPALKIAVEEALAFWGTVVERASLPNWEIVSFSIDQIDTVSLAGFG